MFVFKLLPVSQGPLPATTPSPALTNPTAATTIGGKVETKLIFMPLTGTTLIFIPLTGTSGNCESLLSGKSGWSGAFGATFNLPVASALTSFKLVIETDQPLSKITFWDADVTPTSGNSFTVTNKSWFGGKQAGETLSLGFQVLLFVF